jgi:hypothetical protein
MVNTLEIKTVNFNNLRHMEYTDTTNSSFFGKILVLVLILGVGFAAQRIYVKNHKKSTTLSKSTIVKNVDMKSSLQVTLF